MIKPFDSLVSLYINLAWLRQWTILFCVLAFGISSCRPTVANNGKTPSNISTRFDVVIGILTTLSLAVVLSGCASMGTSSLYIHNVEKAKQAGVASEAADKLNLANRFQVERANQEKILTRELSLVQAFAITRQQDELQLLLESSFNNDSKMGGKKDALSLKAQSLIKERKSELLGSRVPEAQREIASLQNRRGPAIDGIQRATTQLEEESIRVPIFDLRSIEVPFVLDEDERTKIVEEAIKNMPDENSEDVRETVNDLLNEFVTACNVLVPLNKELAKVLERSGDIYKAATKLEEAKNKKTILKKYMESIKKEYDTAVAAVKEAEDNSKGMEAELQKKVERIRTALNNLPKEAGALGQKEAAEKQIDSIDTLLLAASGSSKPKDEDSNKEARASAIVAQLPSFYGRVAEIAAMRKAPSLNSLILEKSRLQALRTDAEKGIKRMDTEIDLLQTKYDALRGENQSLSEADHYLYRAKSANQGKAVALEDLKDSNVSEEAQRYTVMGIAMYLGTFTSSRRAVHEIEYRLIDLKHQAAVDRSEIALVLWQTAIAQPTKSLSAYYAGGLKPEHFIELLKALGLAAIAVGVY